MIKNARYINQIVWARVKMKATINKIIILVLIVISMLGYASAIDFAYNVTLDNFNDTLTLGNIEVVALVNEEITSGFGEDYRLEVISFDNLVLYTTFFDTHREIISEGINSKTGLFESELIIVDLEKINNLIPYYEEAREIRIINLYNNKVLFIDVSMFSKEYSETGLVIGDQDIGGEENQRTVKDEKQGKTITDYWWILLIILTVLILILFYSLRKKK